MDAHPSNYEAVPGGLPDIRRRVEALQRRFNEESKVGSGFWSTTHQPSNPSSLPILCLDTPDSPWVDDSKQVRMDVGLVQECRAGRSEPGPVASDTMLSTL